MLNYYLVSSFSFSFEWVLTLIVKDYADYEAGSTKYIDETSQIKACGA